MILKQNILNRLLLVSLCILVLSSCAKRDIGCDGTCESDLTLTLKFDAVKREGPIMVTTGLPNLASYDMRIIVDVYKNTSNPQASDKLQRFVKTVNTVNAGINEVSMNVRMPSQNVLLLVWADYVSRGSTADLYYNTADLTELKIIKPYKYGDDSKAAFTAAEPLDLRQHAAQAVSKTILLESPFASYKVVSNDVKKYQTMQLAGESPAHLLTRQASYELFLPFGYNVAKQEANHFESGIAFNTSLSAESSADTVVLMYDYVFVSKTNPSMQGTYNSHVGLSMAIYATTGIAINAINGLNVPLRRGWMTIVKGPFLTTEAGTGIGVDPDFEGNIDINLPD